MAETTQQRKTKSRIDFVDIHIGKRLCAARRMADISQTELGARLNVSFQQIQKYERGTNRVSAANLRRCMMILNQPFDFFFEGLADTALPEPALTEPYIHKFTFEDYEITLIAKRV